MSGQRLDSMAAEARWHRGRRRPPALWPVLLALALHGSLIGPTAAQHARGQRLDKGSFVAVGRRLRGSLQLNTLKLTMAADAQHSSRGLMQSGVPPPKRNLAEKIAHAAEVRAMKPDLLLKNLRIREQNTTEFIPEACAERDELDTTTCVPLHALVLLIASASQQSCIDCLSSRDPPAQQAVLHCNICAPSYPMASVAL